MQVERHGHVDQSNGRREREKEMDLSDIYWSKFHKNLDGICSNNNNIVLLLQGCQNYERKRFTVLLYCVFNDCRMYSDSPYFIPDLGDLCLLFIFVFVVKGFLDFFDLKKKTNFFLCNDFSYCIVIFISFDFCYCLFWFSCFYLFWVYFALYFSSFLRQKQKFLI